MTYISREAAIETLSEFYHHKSEIQHIALREALNRVPTADVVDVVRCKECIHDNSNDPICPIPWVKRMLDSYCSFGERRADNG